MTILYSKFNYYSLFSYFLVTQCAVSSISNFMKMKHETLFSINHIFYLGNIVNKILFSRYKLGGYVLCQNGKTQMQCEVSIVRKIGIGISLLVF